MLFVTCHDIYSKILSKLTKSVPKCLIYTHCFRARSLFIFGNLFFWTGMLHSSSSMSSYSISFSRTNRSSSIYLTPLPFCKLHFGYSAAVRVIFLIFVNQSSVMMMLFISCPYFKVSYTSSGCSLLMLYNILWRMILFKMLPQY